MNIHLHKRGVCLVGKAWEIKQKLQEYSQHYHTVSDWINNESSKNIPTKIIEFPRKDNST